MSGHISQKIVDPTKKKIWNGFYLIFKYAIVFSQNIKLILMQMSQASVYQFDFLILSSLPINKPKLQFLNLWSSPVEIWWMTLFQGGQQK